MMIDFLETNASKYGYAYGIQEIPDVAMHLSTQGMDYAISHLSDTEYTMFCNFRSEKRRKEWLAGRIAAKKAFQSYNSHTSANYEQYKQICVLSYPSRAPYIADFPGLSLSISHSNDYSVAVICSSNIGIDIEWIEPRPAALANRFFCQAERNMMEECCQSPADLDVQITRFWSRKEALAKFLQLGGSLDFRSLDTSEDVIIVDEASCTVIRLISGRLNGYWISLALQG